MFIKYIFAAVFLLFPACAARATFYYQPSPKISGEPICNEGVAIVVFEDLRGGNHPLNHNLKNLALIPFVPFATSYRDFPERTYFDDTNNLNGFDPARDLAAAFAAEVEAQGIFSKYKKIDGGLPHGERYELRGRLRDSHVSEGYITYGISIFSPLLHIVGFPEGTLRCVLVVDVELMDRRDASILWKQTFDGRRTRATWIHQPREAEEICSMFSSLAAEWIRPAALDLRRTLLLRGK